MQVMDFLGSAAFSKAVQALDTMTGQLVCLKIVKVRSRLHPPNAHCLPPLHLHACPAIDTFASLPINDTTHALISARGRFFY